jgi:hypothetical protein
MLRMPLRGVSFSIRRAYKEAIEKKELHPFVVPRQPTKWRAHLDAIHESRLTNGVHIGAWLSATLNACEPKIGPGLRIGSTTVFSPRLGVPRFFCGVCGATLLQTQTEDNIDSDFPVVNISMGIVRAPDSVMAENYVEWRGSKIERLNEGLDYDREYSAV